MASFLNKRRNNLKARGEDGRNPFLLAMGTLARAANYGGVPRALMGIGLAAPGSLAASDILHPHHLTRPDFLNDKGAFRWPTGLPLLRVWLTQPALPIADIIGGEHRRYYTSDGNRVVPLDDLAPGLQASIGSVLVQEVELDRPRPLPDFFGRMERTYREGHFAMRPAGLRRVRDTQLADDAMQANLIRYGRYQCIQCGYAPIDDVSVPSGRERAMLDAHHQVHIAVGERESSVEDVVVLCPTCHRREHVQEAGVLVSKNRDE